jgi:drug/metabolite transporter (DMT)-like permease
MLMRVPHDHARALGLLMVATVLWASTPVLIKLVPYEAFAHVAARCGLTTLVLLWLVGAPRRLSRVDLVRAAFQAGTTGSFMVSTTWGTPEASTVLFYTSPILSALAGPWLSRRRGDASAIAAGVGVALGTWLVVRRGLGEVSVRSVLAGLSAATCFAIWAELSRRQPPTRSGQDLVVGMGLLAVVCAPALAAQLARQPALGWTGGGALVAGAVIAAYGFYWMDRALIHLSPTAVVLISAAEVPLVFLWTVPFYGTWPTLEAALGGLLVFASVAWMGWRSTVRR